MSLTAKPIQTKSKRTYLSCHSRSLFIIILLAFFPHIAMGGTEEVSWNYQENGPDAWPHIYPECRGKRQSPIDISEEISVCDDRMEPIEFINYNSLVKWKADYDGKTVKLTPLNKRLQISGSNFNTTYDLLQFHFHWGYNDYQGSEHQVNKQKFPLEVHLVHKSSANQLAVVGFLFELSAADNVNLRTAFNTIGRLNERNPSTTLRFNLKNLINFEDANTKGYYRYMGSLTTPPCSENVIWTVFECKIKISSRQLDNFHSKLQPLNFREPQSLESRWVLKKC